MKNNLIDTYIILVIRELNWKNLLLEWPSWQNSGLQLQNITHPVCPKVYKVKL